MQWLGALKWLGGLKWVGVAVALFLYIAIPASLAQPPGSDRPPWTDPRATSASVLTQLNEQQQVSPPLPSPQPIPGESPQPAATPAPSIELPGIPNAFPSFSSLSQNDTALKAKWIQVDGTRIFQVADYPSRLPHRYQQVRANLQAIHRAYLADPAAELRAEVLESNGLLVLYINDRYLMTITQADAQFQQLEPEDWAEQLRFILLQSLETLYQQHQPVYLIAQAKRLALGGLGLAVLSGVLARWRRQVHRQPIKLLDFDTNPWIKRLSRQHQTRLRAVKLMLIQLSQVSFWAVAVIFSLSRFPQTRPFAVYLVSLFRIPVVLGLALLGAYILIRLSHIVIDRFNLAISANPLVTETATDRAQQRIGTLARVLKGLSLGAIALSALITALVILGINVAPLLAGAGILGVGISLASQGLIKDAINGFLILLEDQYGVGDVIQIGEWIGLVETLNLRMTQLRNAEGKLITIPNSEVRVVANLSNHWSRVDLNVPVPYEADLATMMTLVESTAVTMMEDDQWQDLILEAPQLMGVEDFSDRGIMLKLWIKTQPLKQWDVAREYRRRLKLALDQADVQIPLPQRSLRLQD